MMTNKHHLFLISSELRSGISIFKKLVSLENFLKYGKNYNISKKCQEASHQIKGK